MNISSDGHFEDTEQFLVTLSTIVLQLNTDSIKLKTICQEGQSSNLFSLTNDNSDRAQVDTVPLDQVILAQTMDGITFSLASNENERVIVSPEEAMVTIMDNDCK